MTDPFKPTASARYALGRLEQAARTLATHPDLETRARAKAKTVRWQQVLQGMSNGQLEIGSRTPVAEVPAWATLEVAHGGFATGGLLAGGPLTPEERALHDSLPAGVPGVTDRARLNAWYLSDEGQAQLLSALAEGRVDVDLPEASALLIVAWLLCNEHEEAALDLLAELRPWADRLRLYPHLRTQARPAGALVRLSTASEVAAQLKGRKTPDPITTMNTAATVWAPLYDQLISLWLQAVDGEPPRLVDGKVTGGWPARRWPLRLMFQRSDWLRRYERAREAHPGRGKHVHPKSNFSRLREALQNGLHSARDAGWVRRALANTVTRHGAPGSSRRSQLRAQQSARASQPAHRDLAEVLATRLGRFPVGAGLPDTDCVRGPVRSEESGTVATGSIIPAYLMEKTTRALEAPVEELVERGVIGSCEVLAEVVPQITADVVAASIASPDLRAVFSKTYAAFRRRRSLLLLNYERQVQLEELPWIEALSPLRSADQGARASARQTLEQVVLLALGAFPHTILPNPMVQELKALLTAADCALPLVEEVAADIFMGGFTAKWPEAALIAGKQLQDTLYGRYYDLPPAQTWPSAANDKGNQKRFDELCVERAQEAGGARAGGVAKNGAILEQSQILTTQNLAALTVGLELQDRLLPSAHAEACLAWVQQRWSRRIPQWHAELTMLKNTAYALRQAIYFLSLCTQGDQERVLLDFDARVAAQPCTAERFKPVTQGLLHVASGGRFDAHGRSEDGRRLLGWSVGPHWLGAARA